MADAKSQRSPKEDNLNSFQSRREADSQFFICWIAIALWNWTLYKYKTKYTEFLYEIVTELSKFRERKTIVLLISHMTTYLTTN